MIKKIPAQVKTWIYLCGGNLFYSLSLCLFLTGNNIAAGGLAGIAVVLRKFIPLGVGVLTLLMNIPILISAVFVNGWRYTVDTIIAAFLYSFIVDVFGNLPTLTSDPITAAIFGGVLYGIGMALLTIGNASVGGTDLVCRLLNKGFPFISVAKMSLLIDGSVVLLAMVVFGNVEVGLYAVLTIAVCSFVADKIVMGIDRGNVCMIVTDKEASEVANPLMKAIGRAVTRWEGNGMYSGAERNVLIVAIRPKEVHNVKRLIQKLDSGAFVLIIPATELIGGNFSSLMNKSQ